MNQQTADIFTEIYQNQAWGHGETRSGWESTMLYTRSVRDNLSPLLKEYNMYRLIDLGCGDHNWASAMLTADIVGLQLDYTGIDCVAPVIDHLNSFYTDNWRRRFICADVCEDPIPYGEVALVRNVMFHLTQTQQLALLRNYVNSGIPYLLASTYTMEGVVNVEGQCGQFAWVDLYQAPFNLPVGGIKTIVDYLPGDHEKHLVLWTREQVQQALGV